MAQCHFRNAWKSLLDIKKQYPLNSELIEVQLNLITALNHEKAKPFLIDHFGKSQNNLRVINAQSKIWKSMKEDQKLSLTFFQKSQFAIDLLLIDQIQTVESIYNDLQKTSESRNEEIAILARKIAMYYQSSNKPDLAKNYNDQAQQLMKLSYS